MYTAYCNTYPYMRERYGMLGTISSLDKVQRVPQGPGGGAIEREGWGIRHALTWH